MPNALLVATALLVAAARPPTGPLSDREFQNLMEVAAAAASPSSVAPALTWTICVQRELDPPTSRWNQAFQSLPTGGAEAAKSVSAGKSPKGATAQQTTLRTLPTKFTLIAFGARPPQCTVSRNLARGPNWQRDESVVVWTFTRPVLANGYAFIEEYEDCAGLCGTRYLRVFRKQSGKWKQVAVTILSVS